MTKGELVTIISGTPEDELGDMLLQLAITYWLEQGCSDEDIQFLVEEVLEESSAS